MSTTPEPVSDPRPSGMPGESAGLPASPLDEMQFLTLRQAVIRRRPIRRAARVARGSAWTILIVGFSGWPALFFMPSMSGLLVVAGICGVGALEYIGAGKMHDGDPSAPRFLARNQLIFVVLIAAYCVYQMLSYSPAETASSPQMKDEMALLTGGGGDLGHSVQAMLPVLTYVFWFLVLFTSAIGQGCLAVYYFSRRKYVDLYDRETPDWVKRIVTEVES